MSSSFFFFLGLASLVSAVYDQSQKCDACRTLNEEFHRGWEDLVRKQAGDGQAERKSDAPPTITYNQDIEDYLQGFCKSPRINPYDDYIRKGCHRVMDVHKREFVAKYLSVSEVVGSSLKVTNVPRRIREICGEMTKECTTLPPTYDPNTKNKKMSKCEACKRVVMDAQFTLRRTKKYSDKLKSMDVFEMLEKLCTDEYLRYDDQPDTVFEVCEEIMSDHEDVLLRSLAAKDKNVVENICRDAASYCSKSDFV